MQGLTLLKDMNIGSPNILQLLKSFVFGDRPLEFYDETKTYVKGDIVLIKENNTVIVKQAEETVTGTYDPSKWSDPDLTQAAATNAQNIVIFSKDFPTVDDNKLWVRPAKRKNIKIPFMGEITRVSLTFDANDFPMVDETVPQDIEQYGLFFDYEGTDTSETSTEFNPQLTSLLDDQSDVEISPNVPEEDVPLWIDTDLTDDN